MAGNKQTAVTTKAKHGSDFYKRIAPMATDAWRENGCQPRGFACLTPEQRNAMSRKGGLARANKQRRTTSC